MRKIYFVSGILLGMALSLVLYFIKTAPEKLTQSINSVSTLLNSKDPATAKTEGISTTTPTIMKPLTAGSIPLAPPSPSLITKPIVKVEQKDKDGFTVTEVSILANSSFYETLVGQNIPPKTVIDIITAAKSRVNLSDLNPETVIDLAWDKNLIKKITLHLSPAEELIVQANAKDEWQSSMIKHTIVTKPRFFSGEISSTLWDSAVEAGMPVDLIYNLAEIFAWQIDFSRELVEKDRWSVLIEEQTVEGKLYGYGAILAAEIQKNSETLPAFLFVTNGKQEYYDRTGKNLRGKFLKSPLKYSRITSRFQFRRFHPILKFRRPHHGVDYAAPSGTPIRSVGDGVVVQAGWNGGSGRMVKVRHDSMYMTAYKHLSRIGKGIKVGQRVDQAQVIGYVGQTGLATGPHLHFEFYERNQYVDPLGKRFPRNSEIENRDRKHFHEEVARLSSIYSRYKEEGERIALKSSIKP